MKRSSLVCESEIATQSPICAVTAFDSPFERLFSSSVSSFAFVSGFVSPTTSLPLLAASNQTRSTSGPSAGLTSCSKSSPFVCFLSSAISCGVPGKRPASFVTCFHCAEAKSVFTETKPIEDAGATLAPSGTEPPPPPPPQPVAARAAATATPAQKRLI